MEDLRKALAEVLKTTKKVATIEQVSEIDNNNKQSFMFRFEADLSKENYELNRLTTDKINFKVDENDLTLYRINTAEKNLGEWKFFEESWYK